MDYDELYWNVISSERAEVINSVSATVKLPKTIDISKMKTRLLTDSGDSMVQEVQDAQTFYFSGKNMGADSNFTIVAGWPIGIVQGPTAAERQAKAEEDARNARLWAIV